MSQATSGQPPFVFGHAADLRRLPSRAQEFEPALHGGFAVDRRPDQGQIYYGMPGCGILCISPDLSEQAIIELPDELRPLNFHSTKLGSFDGNLRLFLPANNDQKVVVLTLDGEVDFVLPRPVFQQYQDDEIPFKPTDTVVQGDRLLVADGYGANYIVSADVGAQEWRTVFGGKTEDPGEHGRFGTAHGMNPTPGGEMLAVADRLHARFELYSFDGEYRASYPLIPGSRPCGIDFVTWKNKDYAVVGSLDAPEAGRPAPIYILDAESYQVISTIRPKEELGIDLADHIHNVVWHIHQDRLFLVCQAWNPGFFFVLEQIA